MRKMFARLLSTLGGGVLLSLVSAHGLAAENLDARGAA